MKNQQDFDYVIVGAGSSGCVLANRLSSVPGMRVLLLEAGGWDWHPWIRLPLGWPRLISKRVNDWGYSIEPEPELLERSIECARGKVIGGSSSTNAMAHARGHSADFNRWAQYGLTDWSYRKVLPYFIRQESWEGGASDYRGASGPLNVETNGYRDTLCDAFAEAGLSAGHARTDDYNAAQQEGFGAWQTTREGGMRCSAARAYLQPALGRRELRVRSGAYVRQLIFEHKRAVGVVYDWRGKKIVARVEREVILAAGVVNSPQLLMLSGIGRPEHLRSHEIGVKVASSGVGRNLQDHVSAPVAFLRREPGPLHAAMRVDRMAVALAEAALRGTGIATALPVGDMAFLKTNHASGMPDIQLMFVAAPLTAKPHLGGIGDYPDGFAIKVALLRPESRGAVELASADPLAAPKIRMNLLSIEKDRKVLREGLRLALDISRQRAIDRFVADMMGPAGESDCELMDHVRATAVTVHHPAGTCRMGGEGDPMRVVDEQCRVVGACGLRVVDASVMPDLIGGNINACVIMIAEKVADAILHGNHALR